MELVGVKICFSHIAQYWRKLAAISSLSKQETSSSSGMVFFEVDPAGADLLLCDTVGPSVLLGLLTLLVGEVGEYLGTLISGGVEVRLP